jgi:putative ABC transport system permease protein
MFRLNLKIAWRTLWNHKRYTLINVLGLSVGLAGCMLIFIFSSYQLGFDKGYDNSDRIYRMVTNWEYPGYKDYSKGVPVPMINAAKQELTGIETGGVIINRGGIVHIRDKSGSETLKSRESFYYADPEFFGILHRAWLKGNPTGALSAPNQVALSERTAIRFFGSVGNAMRKNISIGSTINLTVTGIFKDSPSNSSFPLNIVISYSTFNSKKFIYWDGVNSAMEFYVLLQKGQTAETMKTAIEAFNNKHYGDGKIAGNQKNALQALSDIHFDPRYGSFATNTVGKKELYGLALIGLFLILTACINFINLSTAQAANRAKEVGIRKVMGGRRQQLFLQFLTETMTITLIAMVIACVLTELAIPEMSSLLKISVDTGFLSSPVFIGFMLLLVILVGLLAGFYPAIILSGYSPVLAIKNKSMINTQGLGLRRLLVVLQFSITIVLLISTLVIMKQMAFLRDKPLGFNAELVLMVNMPTDSLSQRKYSSFKTQAMRIPGVKQLSYCQTAPSSNDITSSDFSYRGVKNKDFELRNAKADADYFRLFGLQFVAGKAFGKNDEQNKVVVNETFLKKMGITNPNNVIGQMLNANGADMRITGVVKDYNDVSLKEKISALAIYPQKGEYYAVAVKLETAGIAPALKQIERLWNSQFPEYVYESSFLKENLNGYYESERMMGLLFKIAAFVIVFISSLGLFGLISFVTAQRSREVAIRKVLGATTLELVRLLNSSFIKMVLLANVLAWPLAYLFVAQWLQGFEYRIEASIWPFIYAFAISSGITLLTVSIKSYRTAIGNVSTALKYE